MTEESQYKPDVQDVLETADGPAAPDTIAAAPDGPAAPGTTAAAPDGPAAPGTMAAAPDGPATPGTTAAASDGPATPGTMAAAPDAIAPAPGRPEDSGTVVEPAAPEGATAPDSPEAPAAPKERRFLHRAWWFEAILLTVLMLGIVSPDGREKALREADLAPLFEGALLRCVICPSRDMYSSTGLKAGFNYQLLKQFAQDNNCSVSIRMARDEENCVDSLLLGSIDILVAETSDTTITEAVTATRMTDSYCAWYLPPEKEEEMREIDLWLCSFMATDDYQALLKRFYTEYDPRRRVARGITSRTLSPYDDLIKKYAATIGWDWRMLTAVVYMESRFSIGTTSFRGAQGLMQIIPSTARYYGVEDLLDPEQNLIAGTKHLGRIQKAFSGDQFTPENKVNFTLAAYNAGEARISDCRIIAEQKGVNSANWDDIEAIIPDMRKYTITSPDSTSTREGRFRGTETINYIHTVSDLYTAFCTICP